MEKENFVDKHALESGAPCIKHQCVLCCVKTEMPLSQLDIDRITQLGYMIRDFAAKSPNGWRLKNRFGRCVFLSTSECVVYAHRPEGCRLYPLVFDEESRQNVKDDVCPYREEFKVTKNDEKKLTILLQKLRMETTQ